MFARNFTVAALTAMALLSGCVEETAEPNGVADAGADAVVEVSDGRFEATFVSGHLGSYGDCPDEAQDNAAGAPQQEPAGADCAPEEDGGCGGPLNCSQAMLRLQIENTGELALHGFTADPLQVMMDPPVAAEVLRIVDAETDEVIEAIAPGEIRQIRIDFRGPYNSADRSAGVFDGDSQGFPVQVELDADESAPVILITPEVSPLPEVAT